MYTLCRTGREKFIGAEGADLWQDYNKIKFYWPGAFSTLKKKKTVVITQQWDCFLLLGHRIMLLDYFYSDPNLTYLKNI